jgi:hypothetical protein
MHIEDSDIMHQTQIIIETYTYDKHKVHTLRHI